MTPEAAAFLDKARECLAKADGMLGRWPDEAGREAYLAGFHAAQALISEKTGRSVKTHAGTNTEFHRLVRGDTRVEDELRAFLGFAYSLKTIADYQTGPGSKVSPALATEAIRTAKFFVAKVAELLESSAE